MVGYRVRVRLRVPFIRLEGVLQKDVTIKLLLLSDDSFTSLLLIFTESPSSNLRRHPNYEVFTPISRVLTGVVLSLIRR